LSRWGEAFDISTEHPECCTEELAIDPEKGRTHIPLDFAFGGGAQVDRTPHSRNNGSNFASISRLNTRRPETRVLRTRA